MRQKTNGYLLLSFIVLLVIILTTYSLAIIVGWLKALVALASIAFVCVLAWLAHRSH